MIDKFFQSVQRQGVDRVGSHQVVHVHRVGIVGIFNAGAAVEDALRFCAVGGQGLPALAAKCVEVAGIGHLGVGDADFTLEGQGCGTADGVEFFVNGRIHPAHKK